MSPILLQAGAHAALASSLGSALPDRPTLLENLEFQAIGLVIVMCALGGLSLLTSLVGQVFILLEARQKRLAAAAPAPAAAEPAVEAIPVAAIAAAVAATVGAAHRVVEIKPSGAALSWSLEGRRQIFSTRMPRR